MTREERVEARARQIYAWSLAEAAKLPETDWISSYDGEDPWWLAYETKTQALRHYCAEVGMQRKEVSCRREWMWINLDAIEERARDIADEEIAEDGEPQEPLGDNVIAWTWEDSFMYSPCKRTTQGARPYWRCEYAPVRVAIASSQEDE